MENQHHVTIYYSFEGHPTHDVLQRLLSERRIMRSEVSCETLFCLCLNAVVKNHDYFLPSKLEKIKQLYSRAKSIVSPLFSCSAINEDSKPTFEDSRRLSLKTLPNTIVQQLLETIYKQTIQNKPQLISRKNKVALALLLLSNPNVTEFKCGKLFRCGDHAEKDKIFNHLLENCPKMNYYIVQDCDYYYANLEFPALMLSKWKNLKHLEMVKFCMTDESMKVIQEELPLLEKLAFSLKTNGNSDTVKNMTLAGVEYMAKMHKLKILLIVESCYDLLSIEERTNVVGHCAGKAPNLKEFCIDTSVDALLIEFVKFYGEHYSNKELLLTSASLNTSFLGFWPSCLRVENLHFKKLSSEIVEKLCGSKLLPVKEKITFDEMESSQIYDLLEKLGSEITSLIIYRVPPAENFDLNKVMAHLCPHLTNLEIHDSREINLIGLTSECPCIFKKFSCFSVDRSFTSIDSQEEFLKMYKMFLLGSENKGEQLIVHGHTIQTFRKVVLENPFCLAKIKKIELKLFDSCLCTGDPTQVQVIPAINCLGAAAELALSSIKLEHIKLSGSAISRNPQMQEVFNTVKIFVESAGIQLQEGRN